MKISESERVEMHVELNKAFAALIALTLKLDLPTVEEALKKHRSFLSRMVDLSASTQSSSKTNDQDGVIAPQEKE